MPQPVIHIQNLSKSYTLFHEKPRTKSLPDMFGDWFRSLARRGGERDSYEQFDALRSVTSEIYPGDAVGLIGPNGAGKSTLLKILSRITEPTSGRAVLRGRVGSLLEVGTGFHPEMTGRENIFMNGAILGMSKREIRAKFDEIVEFSGVERFLDTPVKRYSSGMFVRLAFAVAAHLDLDVMLVDEVLAVGDISFQQKCLGKMGDISEQGKTVIFVSHSMNAIQRLCNRGLVFNSGGLVFDGPVQPAVQAYLDLVAAHGVSAPRYHSPAIEQIRLTVNGDSAPPLLLWQPEQTLHFEFEIVLAQADEAPRVEFSILRQDRGKLVSFRTDQALAEAQRKRSRSWLVRLELDGSVFAPQTLQLDLSVKSRSLDLLAEWERAAVMQVASVESDGLPPVSDDSVVQPRFTLELQPG